MAPMGWREMRSLMGNNDTDPMLDMSRSERTALRRQVAAEKTRSEVKTEVTADPTQTDIAANSLQTALEQSAADSSEAMDVTGAETTPANAHWQQANFDASSELSSVPADFESSAPAEFTLPPRPARRVLRQLPRRYQAAKSKQRTVTSIQKLTITMTNTTETITTKRRGGPAKRQKVEDSVDETLVADSAPTAVKADGSIEVDLPLPNSEASIPEELAPLIEIEGRITDPDILAMAEKFYKLSHQKLEDKADPIGRPPVYSESREALCESLPYFKAQQGAHQIKGGIVSAAMFDGMSHKRDYMDSEVVISRSGGGQEKVGGVYIDSGKGPNETQLDALRNGVRDQQVVIIIVGKNNSQVQFKVPHRYVVTKHHVPTHVWYEKDENGNVFARFRYESFRPDWFCWYLPQNHDSELKKEPAKLGQLAMPFCKVCPSCGILQEQIFVQGWMCLANMRCEAFWQFTDGSSPAEDQLRYNPYFLKRKTIFHATIPPEPLRPSLQEKLERAKHLGTATKEMAGGNVCEVCGCCSIREFWSYWKCGNPRCTGSQTKTILTLPHISAATLQNYITDNDLPLGQMTIPIGQPSARYSISSTGAQMGLNESHLVFFIGDLRLDIFKLPSPPGEHSFVAHMVMNRAANAEPGVGSDAMWEDFQGLSTNNGENSDSIDLRRRKQNLGITAGDSHSKFYSCNLGEKYSFWVDTETEPLATAPDVLKKARARLHWAVKTIRSKIAEKFGEKCLEEYNGFNEILLLGYLEKQGMAFHDDGEPGLNGTIATLSLGAPATMEFKIHKKALTGVTNTGHFCYRKPFKGCVNWEKRLGLYNGHLERIAAAPKPRKMEKIIGSELLELNAAYIASQKDSKKYSGVGDQKVSIIKFHLGHGDIIFMGGSSVQRSYEHAVHHNGGIVPRISITCREIHNPVVVPDAAPADGNGEENGEANMDADVVADVGPHAGPDAVPNADSDAGLNGEADGNTTVSGQADTDVEVDDYGLNSYPGPNIPSMESAFFQ